MTDNKRRPRVVHIISDLPYGGVEKYLLDLLPHFKDNFDVWICCIREKGKLAQKFEERGIPVDLCYFKGRLHPQSIFNMVRYLKDKKVNIVHTHMYRANTSGTVAGLFAKVPVIISHLHSYPEWDDFKQKKMDGFLSRFKDHIIAVSNSVKRNFIETTKSDPNKISTIYNGVDMSRFSIKIDRAEKKKELGIPESAKVVGIFARLIEDKRHEVFLRAAKEVLETFSNDICFIVVGKGPLERRLKELASSLNISKNTIFTGLREDVPELLKITDIGVLSSRREGFPMIILEAMASGVPFIATNVGGVGEVIENNKSGYIVQPESPEELAKGLITLLKDNKMRNLFSENSRRIVQSYTIDTSVMKIAELYDNIYKRKVENDA
ncbi:glycosyltransferase [bacterium]|nr:glycosyltransferase [bacterium]